jgi:hypothetical protein
MEQISFYLKKFQHLGLREQNIKKVVTETVLELTGVDLKPDEVKIINGSIQINKIGPEKTEIFISKKKIEKEIENRLGNSKKIF